jgi:hypothetical protein
MVCALASGRPDAERTPDGSSLKNRVISRSDAVHPRDRTLARTSLKGRRMSGLRTTRQLERWNEAWSASRGVGPGGQIAIDEIRALSDIDDLLPPEAFGDVPLDHFNAPSSDELRLPPPPVRAKTGDVLFRNLTQFVAKVDADGASTEEKRMGALLKGIHGLELEIREMISRHGRI